jgi:tetratricopeptide (TPR) repeat protein
MLMRARPFLLALAAACTPAAHAQPAPRAELATVTLPPSRSFKIAPQGDQMIAVSENPMSLTASDGTGLKMVALSARAVVEDPLAFTELRLTFENPRDRVIEGHFRMTLPRGASVSRFAMMIDGKYQEGEVVELQAARRAYEDFLHRKQDPALLEQAAGNEFQARVFPIPAKGRKDIIISYSQELVSGEEPYRLPLRGLPELGTLDVKVSFMKDGKRVSVDEHHNAYKPHRDVEVALPRQANRVGLREGELVIARVLPPVPLVPDEVPSLIVLFDTSASRALGLADQARVLRELAAGLQKGSGAATPLSVITFDQTAQVSYEGTAGGFAAPQLAKVLDRKALGASDLSGALRFAAAHGKGRYKRMIILTDGVATQGEVAGDKLRDAARALKGAGVERVDAIALGGIRDEEALSRVVAGAGLVRDGSVIDGSLPVGQIAQRLTRATRSGIMVKVDDAGWSWPNRLDGAVAGEEILVYAMVPPGKPVRITLGDKKLEIPAASLGRAPRPLVERASAKAQIARLTAQRDSLEKPEDAPRREELKDKITDFSVKYRVLSPFTALLVLETEDDYRRFSIDRNALADILTVGPDGITTVDRRSTMVQIVKPPVVVPKPTPNTKPIVEKTLRPEKLEEMNKDKKLEDNVASPNFSPELAKETMDARDTERSRGAPPPPAPARNTQPSPSAEPRVMERRPDPAPRPVESGRRPPVDLEEDMDGGDDGSDDGDDDDSDDDERDEPEAKQPKVNPYTGTFAQVMSLADKGQIKEAVARAWKWRSDEPGDVLALVALGETLERSGDLPTAARAYGSLIDLFPSRADLRRFAGERLERVKHADALLLAVDTYRKAAEQRPDHPASHRLLAFALLKAGKHAEAFDAITAGVAQRFPSGRFEGAEQILREDMGLIAAAWIKADPKKADVIMGRVKALGGKLETAPSLRFILNWETDANDVDFHIYDGKGHHAFYSQRKLPDGGGELYADVTTGYGPECFTIRKSERAYPYKLQAHYYSRGPMGYGMGKVQIVEHDGKGGLRIEERPFVVMQDSAFVELGTVTK